MSDFNRSNQEPGAPVRHSRAKDGSARSKRPTSAPAPTGSFLTQEPAPLGAETQQGGVPLFSEEGEPSGRGSARP